MKNVTSNHWFIYILRCADDTLYTGITKDVARRFDEHQQQGPRCAKYLRRRGPLTLVYTEKVDTHTQALRREIEIKKLARQEKERLIAQLSIL